MSLEDIKAKGWIPDGAGGWSHPSRAKSNGVVSNICSTPATKPEPDSEHARHAEVPRKAIYPGRVLIRITSYCCGEQRDHRNVFDKYGLDCCTKSGLCVDDSPKWIDLIVEEKRVSTKKEEGFEIVITPL